MMADTTPRLALPELVASQAQKHVTHNEALVKLDCMVDLYLINMALTEPPSDPDDGDAYLVATGGADDWSGYDGKIAYCIDGGWRFYAPCKGLRAYNAADSKFYIYSGSAWVDWSTLLSLSGSALVSGRLLVGNASGQAAAVAMSGDATMTNAGAVTVSKIGGKTATMPADGTIVDLASAQTISGIKTFSAQPTFSAGLQTSHLVSNIVSSNPTLSSNVGQYTKIATITISALYHTGFAYYKCVVAGAYTKTCDLMMTVRQQAAFGNNPLVDLIVGNAVNVTSANFAYVVSSNAGPTTVDIYYVPTGTNSWLEATCISHNTDTGASVQNHSTQGFISAPTGAVQAVSDGYAATTTTPAAQWNSSSIIFSTSATYNIGSATYYPATIYAQNALVVVSDADAKTEITYLSSAEIAVGKMLGGIVRIFKMKTAVAEKGRDAARKHAGWIAQEVVAAFEAQGLDAFAYGCVGYDIATRMMVSDDGTPIEAPDYEDDGVTPKKVYSVRMDEIVCFVIAAQEARLAALEAA